MEGSSPLPLPDGPGGLGAQFVSGSVAGPRLAAGLKEATGLRLAVGLNFVFSSLDIIFANSYNIKAVEITVSECGSVW